MILRLLREFAHVAATLRRHLAFAFLSVAATLRRHLAFVFLPPSLFSFRPSPRLQIPHQPPKLLSILFVTFPLPKIPNMPRPPDTSPSISISRRFLMRFQGLRMACVAGP